MSITTDAPEGANIRITLPSVSQEITDGPTYFRRHGYGPSVATREYRVTRAEVWAAWEPRREGWELRVKLYGRQVTKSGKLSTREEKAYTLYRAEKGDGTDALAALRARLASDHRPTVRPVVSWEVAS